MPNPDVKAVRATLAKVARRIDPSPDPEGSISVRLASAFITHGLRVCDVVQSLQPDETVEFEARSQLVLIAAILSDANLLPKEGA